MSSNRGDCYSISYIRVPMIVEESLILLLGPSAEKHSEKLSVIKYDVEGDNVKDLKVELLLQGVMVRGLPTLILYHNGKPLDTHSGAITEQGLENWLQDNLFSKIDEVEAEDIQSTTSEMKQREEPKAEEKEDPKKRGFVSFTAQIDDYMLSE